MRIDGPGRAGGVARSRKSARSGSAAGVFSFAEETHSRSAAETTSSGPIGGLDTLLTLQAVGGVGERRARVRHGNEMLDLLEDIKISLLGGEVPAAKLQTLLDSLSRRPDRQGDERIETVLDEIELRARVELAKLGREAA